MCQIPELQPEQAAGLVASYSMLIYGDAKTDKPTLCTRAQCLLDRYSSAVWMNVPPSMHPRHMQCAVFTYLLRILALLY